MDTQEFQLVIHIGSRSVRFATREDFVDYLTKIREESTKVDPRTGKHISKWEDYSHFPLLKVVDDVSGEEFYFADFLHLPTEHLDTSTGKRLISIGIDKIPPIEKTPEE